MKEPTVLVPCDSQLVITISGNVRNVQVNSICRQFLVIGGRNPDHDKRIVVGNNIIMQGVIAKVINLDKNSQKLTARLQFSEAVH